MRAGLINLKGMNQYHNMYKVNRYSEILCQLAKFKEETI